MNIKEKAKQFAIKAHMGQVRKNEPDKPMIIHPLSVGKLLEDYGYDDEVIAAGYLHDVVEDTKYTNEDIEKEFGQNIANLVKGASEPDKKLSWEERKKHTIEETKTLSLKNKLVICADKINNLEDLMIKFQKTGERDFSLFKKGEELQKWYYTNIYKSLINNEDENLPIFKRLKNVLDIVFNNNEDIYLKNTIFNTNKEYYDKLKKLHAQKEELQKLKNLCKLTKPFVIEFTGTPRTGKTTTINNLYDFFKKGGFNISIIEEFTTSKYYKEEFAKQNNNITKVERNIKILKETLKFLKKEIEQDKEIILIDRSINDRLIWNNRKSIKQEIPEDINQEYNKIAKDLIDFLVITYTDAVTSLKRDYNNSLALEQRNFLNEENINEYNTSLKQLEETFKNNIKDTLIIDTTTKNQKDTQVETAQEIMKSMRKEYIKSIKKEYKLK